MQSVLFLFISHSKTKQLQITKHHQFLNPIIYAQLRSMSLCGSCFFLAHHHSTGDLKNLSTFFWGSYFLAKARSDHIQSCLLSHLHFHMSFLFQKIFITCYLLHFAFVNFLKLRSITRLFSDLVFELGFLFLKFFWSVVQFWF